jgi:hypothetical protein
VTDLLKNLLYNYGLLQVSITTLEEARSRWSTRLGPLLTDEELAALPIEKDEPVIVVRVSKNNEVNFLNSGEHEIEFTDRETNGSVGNVSVWELPEDEFYFFRAFRAAYAGFATELPSFLFGMCLVHTHALFEHYLRELMTSILLARPEMLGTSKTVKYSDVLESYPSMSALLKRMIDTELIDLFYKSVRDLLKLLRERYGFKGLSNDRDDELIAFSLIRNCIVHNHGFTDARLEEHSKGLYRRGTPLTIDLPMVFAAIKCHRKVASDLDSIAEQEHLTNRH